MKLITSTALAVGLLIAPAHADPISIMSFNVENLFDTVNDIDNPRDDTYLPLATKQANQTAHDALCDQYNSSGSFYNRQCKTLDWSEDVYATKLQRIGDVIKATGNLPDIIVMPETENPEVLGELVSEQLQGFGYSSIVQLDTSDEPDSRGIDVGMISRLPIVGTPSAHVVNFGNRDAEKCGKTRDIVQAAFELPNGETLHVFGVHFPSGGNPIECRIHALKTLNTLHATLGEDALAVAAGDFNFDCDELMTEGFRRMAFRGNWYYPAVIGTGCAAPGSSKYTDRLYDTWNTWSFLDFIMVSPELSPTRPSQQNWFADLGSFQTVTVLQNQIKTDRDDEGYIETRRFDPETGTGVSDHWPVMMRLLQRR